MNYINICCLCTILFPCHVRFLMKASYNSRVNYSYAPFSCVIITYIIHSWQYNVVAHTIPYNYPWTGKTFFSSGNYLLLLWYESMIYKSTCFFPVFYIFSPFVFFLYYWRSWRKVGKRKMLSNRFNFLLVLCTLI